MLKFRCKMSQAETVRQAVQYGTDMDYASAVTIGKAIIELAPYYRPAVPVQDMPKTIAGLSIGWILEILVRKEVGVFE